MSRLSDACAIVAAGAVYFLVVWVIPKSLGAQVCLPNGFGGFNCF
jgi:hypothetical protein